MELPTFKSALFWHASFSVAFVRTLYILSNIRSRIKSVDGVATLLFEIVISVIVYFTLATMLAAKAMMARRSPNPAIEARLDTATGYVFGRKLERYAVRGASFIWFSALWSNVSVLFDKETVVYLDYMSLRPVWEPLAYIMLPLILALFVANGIMSFYILCIWPRTAVRLVRREAPNAVPVPLYRQPAGPGPLYAGSQPAGPPAYTTQPGGSIDVELGMVPVTTDNDNEPLKLVDTTVNSGSGSSAGTQLPL